MFSKYEQVEEIQSIYHYPDTEVLINKLDIMNEDVLKHVEADFAHIRITELHEHPVNGRFSMTHLMNIHKYIFQDIYPFAGKVRTEEITKGSTRFYWCNQINARLKTVLKNLQEEKFLVDLDNESFVSRLSYYMSELNLVHPFREGNGRAIREFIRELALMSGRTINWQLTTSNKLLDGAIRAVDFDYSILEECLREVIE